MLFFSIEMSETENVARLLSSRSGVSLRSVLVGPWQESDETKIMRAAGELAELPLHMAEAGQRTIAAVRSEARMVRQEHGLDLIVVDYLQLIQAVDQRANRTQQVTEVTHGLKALAMDLDVPILAVAQLNREFHNRPDKRPILSDLRESGSIEQDADVVIFLHRDDLYFMEEDWERMHPGTEYPRNMAELIVAKQRNGPTGFASVVFQPHTTTFRDTRRGML